MQCYRHLALMPVSDPSDTLTKIDLLRKEVLTLTDLQARALKDAIYLGMNSEDAKVYDERRRQITRLMNEISLLRQAL